jgi:hypothetical protein
MEEEFGFFSFTKLLQTKKKTVSEKVQITPITSCMAIGINFFFMKRSFLKLKSFSSFSADGFFVLS